MIRLLRRIFVVVILAFLSAFAGDVRGIAADPVAAAEQVQSSAMACTESTPDTESTETLDETPGDEHAGALLGRLPGETRVVLSPSFERTLVIASPQESPPTVDQETPTRPPRRYSVEKGDCHSRGSCEEISNEGFYRSTA